jgi:phage terminase large subunit-like protein
LAAYLLSLSPDLNTQAEHNHPRLKCKGKNLVDLRLSSPAERLAQLSPEARAELMRQLTDREIAEAPYNWEGWWARSNQLQPTDNPRSFDGKSWTFWLLLAGRGFGKTRTGAQTVIRWTSEGHRRIALVAPTQADIRDVLVEGPGGIMRSSPPWNMPNYEPSKRHKLTWPNGACAWGYSAEEPERLRGVAHDASWCDELGAWSYPDETWDQLMFGMRECGDIKIVVTTTPRPIRLLTGTGRDGQRLGLLNDPRCVVTRGSSYENRSNLAADFFAQIVGRYEGTRLGRQEIEAEILDDVPGALWTHKMLDDTRTSVAPYELVRVVVAIDPAVTSGDESDETGIVVVARDARGHGYVLADCSGRYAPNEWAQVAVDAYRKHQADVIVAEVNNGGELVEATLRQAPGGRNLPYRAVRASRGKAKRAQPISMLWETGRAHVVGSFPRLEDQMCLMVPDFDANKAGYSPDRCDSLVWGMTDLFVDDQPAVLWDEDTLIRVRA